MIKVSVMARLVGVSRQTIYNKMPELEQKGFVVLDKEGKKALKEDAEQYLLDTLKKGVKDRIITVKKQVDSKEPDSIDAETIDIDSRTGKKEVVKGLVKELLKEKDLRINDLQGQVISLQNQVETLQQENAELTKVLAGTLNKFTGQKTDNKYKDLQLDTPDKEKKGFFRRLLGK